MFSMASSLLRIDMNLPRDSLNIFFLVTVINLLFYLSCDSAEVFLFQAPIILFWIVALYSGTIISDMVYSLGKIWQKFRRFFKVLLLVILFFWCYHSEIIRNIACGYFTTKGFGYIFIESNQTKLIVREVVDMDDISQSNAASIYDDTKNDAISTRQKSHLNGFSCRIIDVISKIQGFFMIVSDSFRSNDDETANHESMQAQPPISQELMPSYQSPLHSFVKEGASPIYDKSILRKTEDHTKPSLTTVRAKDFATSAQPKPQDNSRAPFERVPSTNYSSQDKYSVNMKVDKPHTTLISQSKTMTTASQSTINNSDVQLLKRKLDNAFIPSNIDPDYYRMAKKLVLADNEVFPIPKPTFNETAWSRSNTYEQGRPALSRKVIL
jgi:hypothetical protein